MRHVAVRIAYLGKDFFGSQIQPERRTVEGDILSDLSLIHRKDGEWFDLKLASRTDRGVNAIGNVAVFNTDFKDNMELMKALNAVSLDVFYISVADVDGNFNPRHAVSRTYRYVLPSKGIDIELARECASLFIGEHDFARFSKSDGKPTIVNMEYIRTEETDGYLTIEFKATHFLWNMIRRIVAAISSVGRGDSSMDDVKKALNGDDLSFGLARPDALTLSDISYNDLVFESGNIPSERIDEEMFSLYLDLGFYSSLKK